MKLISKEVNQMIMEKKRKLSGVETVENDKPLTAKKKKKYHNKKDNTDDQDSPSSENIKVPETDMDESKKSSKQKKSKRKQPENDEESSHKNQEITIDNEASESQTIKTLPDETDLKKVKRKKKNTELGNGQINKNNETDSIENKDESDETEGDGINTPTTKKPPRKSGETKKQYKRRMKALREAGLLIDPPIVEGVKKDKRNRKTRKEKRMAKQHKNEELEKFRSIVQINYLKAWKTDPSKWKFNKNVQGKIIKHMFDKSRIPQDIFEILIEYIMGTNKSTKMHEDINKKCSQVVEAMEKWTSADDEEKKKLTEPDKEIYDRARQVLQSLA